MFMDVVKRIGPCQFDGGSGILHTLLFFRCVPDDWDIELTLVVLGSLCGHLIAVGV